MPTVLTTIKWALRGEFEVFSAVSGIKGLELMERDLHFDLLLLDVALPDISGFELLETLSGHHKLHELPVILITGSADEASVVRAHKAGVKGYIVKPFTVETLRSKVREILGV